MKAKTYALYIGDRFINIGTISEIARLMNVESKTVYFWRTPTYQSRIADYNKRKILVEV